MRLFPDEHEGDSLLRAQKVWDLSRALPVPRHQLRCPACAVGWLAIKDWKFHLRSGVGSAHPWRCDVRLKCMTCGGVHMFGVIVPRAMFEAMQDRRGPVFTTWLHWREGRKILEETT